MKEPMELTQVKIYHKSVGSVCNDLRYKQHRPLCAIVGCVNEHTGLSVRNKQVKLLIVADT